MNCIQCRTKPAKFREADEASRVYCSRECFYIGLNGDDDVVGLVTSDGVEFTIPIEIARKMKTVSQLIQDSGPDAWIPLPRVNSKILNKILDTLQSNREDFLDKFEAAVYLDIDQVVVESFRKFVETVAFSNDLKRFKDQVNRIIYFLPSSSVDKFIKQCEAANIDTTLLKDKVRIRPMYNSWLEVAALLGLLEDVKFLLLMGEKDTRDLILKIAISRDDFEMTRYLVQNGFKKSEIELLPAYSVQMVQYLLDTNIIDKKKINIAKMRNYSEDVILLLLDRGILKDTDVSIQFAIGANSLKLLKRIFKPEEFDDSLLQDYFEWAVSKGQVEIVEFFLEQGFFLKMIPDLISDLDPENDETMIRLLEKFAKRVKKS